MQGRSSWKRFGMRQSVIKGVAGKLDERRFGTSESVRARKEQIEIKVSEMTWWLSYLRAALMGYCFTDCIVVWSTGQRNDAEVSEMN